MARYDKVRDRNKKRDERIRRVYATHPDLALQEIAKQFGLKSRQHVFLIVHGDKKRQGSIASKREAFNAF